MACGTGGIPTAERALWGGSDGSQIREYKLSPNVYFPVESPVTPRRPAQHLPRVAPELWPEIAKRAERQSLRYLAAEYGVSHETIRTILQRKARKQVAEAARVRLAPSAECASRAAGSPRQVTAGSS